MWSFSHITGMKNICQRVISRISLGIPPSISWGVQILATKNT